MKAFLAVFTVILLYIIFCGESFGQRRAVLERIKPLGIRSGYFLMPNKNKVIKKTDYHIVSVYRKEPFYNFTYHKTYQREEIRRMACF